MALTSRRRYGHSTDGGYKHGEVKFNVPLQVRLDTAPLDESFISALGSANASGTSQTIKRLTTALPFVSLANTDDELMEELAEAILMGSAFEQLLNGDASSYLLGKRFGELFAPYGSVTVNEALKVRPGIEVDPKYSPRRGKR